MSPEQLEGKESDTRSDVWSLGCVLYEMATGKRAFEGKSQASLIAAILEHEPEPITTLQPMSPPALERLVRACLAKDPDDRVQTAQDVKLQLEWLRTEGSSISTASAAPVPSRSRRAWWAIPALLIVVAVAAFFMGRTTA
jgi:serine/threonine protein kinase